ADLGLNRRAVVGRERAVLVLHGQVTDALEHRVHLVQGTLSGLDERDAVLSVAVGLVEAADLGAKALADGEASGVVRRRVDAVARRKASHRLLEPVARLRQVTLGVERSDVVLDTKGHRSSLLDDVDSESPGDSVSPVLRAAGGVIGRTAGPFSPLDGCSTYAAAAPLRPRFQHSTIAPAIWPSGRTSLSAPRAAASRGMP